MSFLERVLLHRYTEGIKKALQTKNKRTNIEGQSHLIVQALSSESSHKMVNAYKCFGQTDQNQFCRINLAEYETAEGKRLAKF